MATQKKDVFREADQNGKITIINFCKQRSLMVYIRLSDLSRGYLEEKYPYYYEEYLKDNTRKINIIGFIVDFKTDSQLVQFALYEEQEIRGIPKIVKFNHPECLKNSIIRIPLNLIDNLS